jgi:hypothetical protein
MSHATRIGTLRGVINGKRFQRPSSTAKGSCHQPKPAKLVVCDCCTISGQHDDFGGPSNYHIVLTISSYQMGPVSDGSALHLRGSFGGARSAVGYRAKNALTGTG